MSVAYNVFVNDGMGGPVNYGSPIATISPSSIITASTDAFPTDRAPTDFGPLMATLAATTWTSSALAFPGDYTFAVRAFDTVTGYEELNVDCRTRLILNSSGLDITAQPNAPTNVSAITTANGGVRVDWHYSPIGQNGAPTGFLVYMTAGSTPGYGGSPVSVPYAVGQPSFTTTFAGLTDATTYTVSVRATNATATEPNVTAFATFIADATPPTVVDGLTATVGAIGP
jgi:hypothetical protein